jgi:ketosteroid isomerase-like protein
VSIAESDAAKILYEAHEAWNRRDLSGLLGLFEDDMTYWSNVGTPEGETTLHGKAAFENFLAPMLGMEGLSVPRALRFKDDAVTASVEFYLRDLHTGHSHSGTFRQVLKFRQGRIHRIEEYHDAPALTSFMALLNNEPRTSP